MRIQKFTVGMLSTNCYVVNCSETREAIVIDPGFDSSYEAGQIINYVDSGSLDVKFIVNTHGHDDHIGGNMILKKKYQVPICIHANDEHCLNDLGDPLFPSNVLLDENEMLKIGHVTLKVMHTPGHTPGSLSIVGENFVFTGDTLFAGGIGRTDFAGGSDFDMKFSLKKLLSLPENYVIYPGHGVVSTIGREKRDNPFLNWL
jgi:hydroxyacylglutathione hydrolase